MFAGWLQAQARSSGAVRYCDTTEHWEDPKQNLRVLSIVARASKLWKILYGKRPSLRGTSRLESSRACSIPVLYLTKAKVVAHVGMSEMTYLATMLARSSTITSTTCGR